MKLLYAAKAYHVRHLSMYNWHSSK